jgi:hypothetical protein
MSKYLYFFDRDLFIGNIYTILSNSDFYGAHDYAVNM